MILNRFNELIRLGVNPEAAIVDSLPHKGEQVSTSTSTTTPYQQKSFDRLLAGAGNWLEGGGLDKSYGGSADFDPVANLTQEQMQGLTGTQGTASALNALFGGQGMQALSSYLGPYDPNATGLTSALEAVNRQMDSNFETQVNPQIRQGAQGAGQYGSSRHGIAEGLARSELSKQKLDAGNLLALQDQQAFNQGRLGVLSNLDAIASGFNAGNRLQFGTGQVLQDQAQSEIGGELEKWAYENKVPLNDLLAYQQLVSGNMGGTETSKTKQPGSGSRWGALGTLGGAALGGYFGGTEGARLGAGVGSALF